MTQKFYSHGKLLLSAEYLVVDGAEAFALPCKFGQDLMVEVAGESESIQILWQSFTNVGELWFEGYFEIKSISTEKGAVLQRIETVSSTDGEVSSRLSALLSEAFALAKPLSQRMFKIQTHLEFPQDWGLGSSSTLIANIAKWLQINPYELFFNWGKGSGYDLACADAESGILYRKQGIHPSVKPIQWEPSFKEQLFFVHLGKKQRSDKEVRKYSLLTFDRGKAVAQANSLTQRMIEAKTLGEFEDVIAAHERLLGDVLEQVPIKNQLFPDYAGAIKSLGAWGGDFVLVTKRPDFKSYFSGKGYSTILSFQEMIYAG